MSRDAWPIAARFPSATVVVADLLDPSTLPMALERIDVAYYLAHSMGAGGRQFADRDRQAARNFAQAAKRAGVSQIVYLGGPAIPPTSPTTWPAATRPAPSSPHMACP